MLTEMLTCKIAEIVNVIEQTNIFLMSTFTNAILS